LASGRRCWNRRSSSSEKTAGKGEGASGQCPGIPALAQAVVNCRIPPGVNPDAVERTPRRVVADDSITMKTLWRGVISPASPLRADLLAAIERHTK
jgi:hypothetical protein